MSYLIDKCVLFCFCLLAFPFHGIAPANVCAALFAIAVSAVLPVLSDCRMKRLLPAGYGALQFLFPALCIFLPLISYDWVLSDSTEDNRNRQKQPNTACGHTGDADEPAMLNIVLRAATGFIAPLPALGGLFYCAFFRKNFGALHPFLPLRYQLLLILVGCAAAILLHRKTDRSLLLHRQLLKVKDDGTEMQLLLKERNRSLREKQDSEIYAATLRERNRIAREIHDNVGHLLTRAILMLGAIRTVQHDPADEGPLARLGDTLDDAMNNICSSVHDLHDSSVNLEESLQALIRDFHFCPVRLQYRMSPDLPRELRYSFIAIAKEALVNISRHSNATSASITAIEHPGFYQFVIQDNGTLADTDRAASMTSSSGIGLENMRTRVDAPNGNLSIQTADGFRIYITVPHA